MTFFSNFLSVDTMKKFFSLFQAKKFVESIPVVVKSDVTKDEAEALKATLSKVGAELTVE